MKNITEYIYESKNEYTVDKDTQMAVKELIKQNKPEFKSLSAKEKCEHIADEYKFDEGKNSKNNLYSEVIVESSERVSGGYCIVFRQGRNINAGKSWNENKINSIYRSICIKYGICKCYALKNHYNDYIDISFHFK